MAMISCNVAAYFSDKLNVRSPFGLGGTAVGSVGFIMLLAIPISKPAGQVAATYLIMRYPSPIPHPPCTPLPPRLPISSAPSLCLREPR